ncbi:hypothetical protein T4A_5534 [Trichinella pseudospiralis]|uniref:Uncharacterized protein n=1 Tax=Trichinella pseudospiralis TaxID=6337 RepID=A0A0V1E639_TRIPS|nr:hypothetical protein T4A_5534 [Trichinella pseudospiralis]KRZ43479.1 hypothetical protein T4C_2080 [Trichinella pseudospiralis]
MLPDPCSKIARMRGWLVGWLVGQLNDWTFQTTSKQQNPSTEAFLAVNKKTAWAISSQTYSLIDTATLRSTEAQGRAIEEGLLVDRGYCGQLNNVPNQHNTLARFSRMLHSPNSVCLSLFVYLPPVTTMTSIVRI